MCAGKYQVTLKQCHLSITAVSVLEFIKKRILSGLVVVFVNMISLESLEISQ